MSHLFFYPIYPGIEPTPVEILGQPTLYGMFTWSDTLGIRQRRVPPIPTNINYNTRGGFNKTGTMVWFLNAETDGAVIFPWDNITGFGTPVQVPSNTGSPNPQIQFLVFNYPNTAVAVVYAPPTGPWPIDPLSLHWFDVYHWDDITGLGDKYPDVNLLGWALSSFDFSPNNDAIIFNEIHELPPGPSNNLHLYQLRHWNDTTGVGAQLGSLSSTLANISPAVVQFLKNSNFFSLQLNQIAGPSGPTFPILRTYDWNISTGASGFFSQADFGPPVDNFDGLHGATFNPSENAVVAVTTHNLFTWTWGGGAFGVLQTPQTVGFEDNGELVDISDPHFNLAGDVVAFTHGDSYRSYVRKWDIINKFGSIYPGAGGAQIPAGFAPVLYPTS